MGINNYGALNVHNTAIMFRIIRLFLW